MEEDSSMTAAWCQKGSLKAQKRKRTFPCVLFGELRCIRLSGYVQLAAPVGKTAFQM
jgi:hypothetical protein